MIKISQTHNHQLNAIKKRFKELVNENIVVNGEFIANTAQSKDYLAFVYLSNIIGLGDSKVYSCGIELEKLNSTENCVREMKSYIEKQSISDLWKINNLKKELGLNNSDIADFFNLTPLGYANSSAKLRYESALCKFYEKVKEIRIVDEKSDLNNP